MLYNNLKIAWRYLLKNKFTASINLLGLIVGMTAALFIWQYVHFEKSYDIIHENADNIYRVRTDRIENGVPFMQFAAGAAGAAPVLKQNFAEIEDYVKLATSAEAIFSSQQGNLLRENKVFYTMPSFFSIFSFPLLKGNPETCLANPFTACISESTAKKMFGTTNPVGRTFIRNGTDEYEVTGVFKDCPENSHLKFNILLSYITYSDVFFEGQGTETSPFWDGFYSYLLLKPNTDWKALEAKFPEALDKTYEEDVSSSVAYILQPLKDIHLTSNYLIEAEENGDGKAVSFLFIIGISVLLIAWFNYINLSTANSALRAKEVGVRKVIGGTQNKLMWQFLLEAALLNLFAIMASFTLVSMLHPFFEQLIGESIPMSLFSDWKLLSITLAVLILGTLLSGIYPAFLLSSFKPMTVLKSGLLNEKSSGGINWLRRGLVTLQFVASIGLIACTFIIGQQLNFLRETNLGLSLDQTLVVKGPKVIDSTFVDRSRVFKQEVEQIAGVKSLAVSSTIPGQSFAWTAGGVRRIGQSEEEESYSFHVMAADANYPELYEMELAAGRHMSIEMGSDQRTACLLNEKGAALMQFDSPEAAVGKGIEFWGEQYTVVGVLKDFHQESPKTPVEPLILRVRAADRDAEFYSVKLSTDELSQSLAGIENKWSDVYPGNTFEYFFLDEHFDRQFLADQRFGKVFTLFSGLAIFVSCLGLFALITFITEQKRKEIGVRKILGASVSSIVGLLSKDFLILVGVALIAATPVSWYLMQNWLEGFAKRIDIPWYFFLLAGLMALTIAFITVSFQSLRAALANPVEALRNE